MRIAYVSAPYTGESPEETEANVSRALGLAADLWERGFAVLSPIQNSHSVSLLKPEIPRENYLLADLRFLAFCDVLFVYIHAGESPGCRLEVAEAARLEIPVIPVDHIDGRTILCLGLPDGERKDRYKEQAAWISEVSRL